MPLKLVRRPGSDNWFVRGTVAGTSCFESTRTSTRSLAEKYRVRREGELYDRAVYGARATVTFAHAADSYLGVKARSPRTGQIVEKLINHFGTIKLAKIGQEQLDEAYTALLPAGVSEATKIRAVLGPVQAILTHGAKRKWCDLPAFDKPVVLDSVTAFLRPNEATALVQAAAPHLRPLLVFLIGTGCRVSEAMDLQWHHVDLAGARAVVWQKQQNERHVDLEPVVVTALSALRHRQGHVFRPPERVVDGQRRQPLRYRDSGRQEGGQIKTAWAAACRRAGLEGTWREWVPKGSDVPMKAFVPKVTPHDCRHTWASWDYAIHKDIRRTQIKGGWGTSSMVERYTHLMPEFYVAEARAWLRGAPALVASVLEATKSVQPRVKRRKSVA